MLLKKQFNLRKKKKHYKKKVKSVHDVDLQRYEDFKAKYDPNFSFDKKGGAGSNKIQWPDENKGGSKQNKNEDDLDLYS